MSEHHSHVKHYRSFFWPIVMIGTGVIWLLHNLNMIPTENLWILLRLWPVLIIMAGLDILFARRFALIGALLGLLLIAGVVYVLLLGETLNFVASPVPQTETFSVEVGKATAADLNLELALQETYLHGLSDSNDLFLAKIAHIAAIDFDVSGETTQEISLRQVGSESWYNWFLPQANGEALLWDIGLNPDVPFDIYVDGSTAQSELDLSGVKVSDLEYDGGTGASTIILPASKEGYETRIESGTGAVHVALPEESNLTVWLDSGTGQVVFEAPEDAAVQIEVRSGGTGNLQTPAWITKVSGEAGRDEGFYQSEGFEEAEYQLMIIVEDIGTGNIIIK